MWGRLDVSMLVPAGCVFVFFFFNDTATTEIYTLSLHDALPISGPPWVGLYNSYCSCTVQPHGGGVPGGGCEHGHAGGGEGRSGGSRQWVVLDTEGRGAAEFLTPLLVRPQALTQRVQPTARLVQIADLRPHHPGIYRLDDVVGYAEFIGLRGQGGV